MAIVECVEDGTTARCWINTLNKCVYDSEACRLQDLVNVVVPVSRTVWEGSNGVRYVKVSKPTECGEYVYYRTKDYYIWERTQFHPSLYDPRVLDKASNEHGVECYSIKGCNGWYVPKGWGGPPTYEEEKALKTDEGKPRWSLLMRGCNKALDAAVRIMTFAVQEPPEGKGYQPHSWKDVPNAKERYEDALYRHLSAIQSGEDVDPESGELHWAHVVTNAMFLYEFHEEDEDAQGTE